MKKLYTTAIELVAVDSFPPVIIIERIDYDHVIYKKYCPHCDSLLSKKNDICPNCGGHIDWSKYDR